MSDASAAGMAALSACESLLLSLVENGIIDAAEAGGVLEDAAAVHRQAVPLANGDAGRHEEAAALLEALLAAVRRIERLEAEVARLEADRARWPNFDLH